MPAVDGDLESAGERRTRPGGVRGPLAIDHAILQGRQLRGVHHDGHLDSLGAQR
jgi:hypothetical protein